MLYNIKISDLILLRKHRVQSLVSRADLTIKGEMSTRLTPMRVRGKHNAPEQHQILAKKRRLYKRHASVKQRAQSVPLDEPKPKPKPKRSYLSRLEQLPTELIEIILLHSKNYDLPLVSSTLLSRLSREALQNDLIDSILQTLLHPVDSLGPQDLQNLQGLFERRVLTWPIFEQWMARALPRTQFRDELLLECSVQNTSRDLTRSCPLCAAMLTLYPTCSVQRLKIPDRAFRGPWTYDRLQFLRFWSSLLGSPFGTYGQQDDQVREALFFAIETAAFQAFNALIDLTMVDGEVLEYAVCKGCCDSTFVDTICSRLELNHRASLRSELRFDPLSPVLWQWADEPAQINNGKGEYLKSKLRDFLQEASDP